jgi:prepilin-type N-terminal cleavage/methylation domain-containing protein
MKPRKSGERGITLIELLSVVVIIGIVSALAVPRFSDTINRLKFRSASREMVSMLRLARSYAVTNKSQFGVYFDQNSYIVTLFKDTDNPASAVFNAVADSIMSVDTLPEDFVYLYTSAPSSAVVYRSNGTATSSSFVNFMSAPDDLINYGNIDILASTGRTKITDMATY